MCCLALLDLCGIGETRASFLVGLLTPLQGQVGCFTSVFVVILLFIFCIQHVFSYTCLYSILQHSLSVLSTCTFFRNFNRSLCCMMKEEGINIFYSKTLMFFGISLKYIYIIFHRSSSERNHVTGTLMTTENKNTKFK